MDGANSTEGPSRPGGSWCCTLWRSWVGLKSTAAPTGWVVCRVSYPAELQDCVASLAASLCSPRVFTLTKKLFEVPQPFPRSTQPSPTSSSSYPHGGSLAAHSHTWSPPAHPVPHPRDVLHSEEPGHDVLIRRSRNVLHLHGAVVLEPGLGPVLQAGLWGEEAQHRDRGHGHSTSHHGQLVPEGAGWSPGLILHWDGAGLGCSGFISSFATSSKQDNRDPQPMTRTSPKSRRWQPTAQGGPCPSRVSCGALMDGSGQGSRLGLFSHPDSWETSSSTKYMMFVTAL